MIRTSGIKRQLNFGGIFSPSSPTAASSSNSTQIISSNKNKSHASPTSSSAAMGNTDGKSSSGHSGRKEKRKRKSVSDETSSKQKHITDMFKPLTSPANPATNATTAKQKADPVTTKPSPPQPHPVQKSAASSFTLTHVTPSTTSANLPIDWSLKTRIRITCKNFPQIHRGSFKLSEDAAGVTSFTRCIHQSSDGTVAAGAGTAAAPSATTTTTAANTTCSQSASLAPQMDTSGPAVLRQNTMVWSFPSIAYLQPLFPRIGAQVNSSAGTTPNTGSLSQAAIECLEKEFSQCLRSLIAQCKARQCAYFYVCAATFTVLFRAAGVGGSNDSIHALISPTTKGFRKALTDYGIGFVAPYEKPAAAAAVPSNPTTPVNSSNDSTMMDKNQQQQQQQVEEVITLNDDDEDPDTILTELGLSQQDFPSLQNKPKSKNSSKSRSGSSTGSSSASAGDKSLILITGTDVQCFANLLYESVTKIASAKTGRLAGVPPTILAPVSFIGATLTPFKIKHSRNKGNSISGQTPVPVETFDIIGPILPTNVTALVKQFRSLPAPESSSGGVTTTTTINLMTEENSSPFTHVSSVICPAATVTPSTAASASGPSGVSFGSGVFLQQSLSDSGIPGETIAQLCSPSNQAKKPLKEVVFCPQQEYLSYT
jgi:hypothetical protein